MTKKTFISTLLLVVFSFALAHNVIPHHHHDEISKINTHEHKHHHDNKEQDHPNENKEHTGLFSHSTHIVASTEFTFINNNRFQKIQYAKQLGLFTNLIFKQITVVKQESTNYPFVIPIRPYYATHSLRGPPLFSV